MLPKSDMPDLLKDRCLSCLTPSGLEDATLPEVFAHLAADRVEGFPALAAHQEQGWYQFLVQLAAIALDRAGLAEPPQEPEAWQALLAALTGEDTETAWSLSVADWSRPAFLQPPVRAAKPKDYAAIADTPDGIDLLLTAKAHDLKPARIARPEPQHWVYALVNLQTLQGYLGRGNFGIARMNGGFASRPMVDLIPSKRWGARFRHAAGMLLRARRPILDANEALFDPEDGLALLWLEPWDDDAAIRPDRLDPYFIEVCRRLRLAADPAGGGLVARFRPSAAARIEAKANKGNLGDPWVPVNTKDAAALTVGASGFDYRLVCRILFDAELALPPAFDSAGIAGDRDMYAHLLVLVRGQGRTDGLHERLLPVSAPARQQLLSIGGRARLHEISNHMIRDVADGARRALRNGFCVFLQGGPEQPDFRDARAYVWLAPFDRWVDDHFFPYLWARAAETDEEAEEARRREWLAALKQAVIDAFDDAAARMPAPSARRERARAMAERVFRGMLANHLKGADTGAPAPEPAR